MDKTVDERLQKSEQKTQKIRDEQLHRSLDKTNKKSKKFEEQARATTEEDDENAITNVLLEDAATIGDFPILEMMNAITRD